MKPRDVIWRGVGAMLYAGGTAGALLIPVSRAQAQSAVILVCMLAGLSGLVLLVQGKKVMLALRVENSSHRLLPALIRSRRRERRTRRRR